jgi:hypothetical protein
VYVDGKKAGELRFPWGGVDLTATCQPGGKHVLSLLVVTMSQKDVMLSYTDTNSANEVNRDGIFRDTFEPWDVHLYKITAE